MGWKMNEVLILVPMYNEEKRIDLKAFNKISSIADILFVDDGSKDNTFGLISSLSQDFPHLHCFQSKQNLGKEPVLLYAVQSKIELIRKYRYIAYWDADLSAPLNEIIPMVQFLKDNPDFDSV